MVDVLKKEMHMSFDEAVERVTKTIQDEGFTVLLVKSIDEIFEKKLGITDHPKYTISPSTTTVNVIKGNVSYDPM